LVHSRKREKDALLEKKGRHSIHTIRDLNVIILEKRVQKGDVPKITLKGPEA